MILVYCVEFMRLSEFDMRFIRVWILFHIRLLATQKNPLRSGPHFSLPV